MTPPALTLRDLCRAALCRQRDKVDILNVLGMVETYDITAVVNDGDVTDVALVK